MISRLGLAISRAFHRICPDPLVIAILLTLVTAIIALVFGRYPAADSSFLDRAETLLDAWRFEETRDGKTIPAGERVGIWKLLEFGMQMCLILVTGHALASTQPMRRLVDRRASVPNSGAGAAVLVAIVACLAGLVNWGLGLIVGALMARETGRSCRKRGIAIHYPLLAAAGYMGLLVFHGGLSASAPLTTSTAAAAQKVLPASAVALIGDGISLERTIFSPLNFFVTGGLCIILPLLFRVLTPKRDGDMIAAPIGEDDALKLRQLEGSQSSQEPISIPDRLDRSPIIVWIIALPLFAGLIRYAMSNGLWSVGLNEINALMLALGLALHGSPRSYASAIEDGARDCAGIILQFPIYAGIMALMKASGLVTILTEAFIQLGNAQSLPVMSFIAATLVGLFVPSGGAQWSLQGEITLRAAAETGADQGAMLMSVAYGDELANMLQPFWALPLLAITGVRARDIVGYTAIIMLVAGAWMALGLIIF